MEKKEWKITQKISAKRADSKERELDISRKYHIRKWGQGRSVRANYRKQRTYCIYMLHVLTVSTVVVGKLLL